MREREGRKAREARARAVIAGLLLLAAALPCGASAKTYRFKVFLDDSEIGYQQFDVAAVEGRTEVVIEAAFDVKFLFITAYRYRHENREVWRDGCLERMESTTLDGGEEFFVRAVSDGGGMTIERREAKERVEGCLRSFVYWDPSLLEGERLLNSQSGEVEPVRILSLGEEKVPVRGVPAAAERRRIVAGTFAVDLWYAGGTEWVALESTASNGGRLRYLIE